MLQEQAEKQPPKKTPALFLYEIHKNDRFRIFGSFCYSFLFPLVLPSAMHIDRPAAPLRHSGRSHILIFSIVSYRIFLSKYRFFQFQSLKISIKGLIRGAEKCLFRLGGPMTQQKPRVPPRLSPHFYSDFMARREICYAACGGRLPTSVKKRNR